MALFPSTAIASAAGGYDVSYSCRFSEANKHYLYRTMSSAGNRRTWTISFWYKKGNLPIPLWVPYKAVKLHW